MSIARRKAFQALGSGDYLDLRAGFRGNPYGHSEDGRRASLGAELGWVFGLQLLPSQRLKEDGHGIVSSTKNVDLVDDFVGYSHESILRWPT